MNHIPEYVVAVIVSIIFISSLFIFHKFWAKTTKTIWVRLIFGVWMLGNQIYTTIWNGHFDLELCHLIGWSTALLMLFPTKFQVDIFLPLVFVGPGLSILGGIVGDGAEFGFNQFRYYNYYYGHLTMIIGYLYIYLYDYTGARLIWKSMQRSSLFGLMLLTFVMVINMALIPDGHSPLQGIDPNLSHSQLDAYWGVNYIFGHLSYNIGVGHWSLLNQYFIVMYAIGPMFVILAWIIIYFARPIYVNRGSEKLKFNIYEDILGIKTTKPRSKHNDERFSLNINI
ncbi:TMEM164 family acyltransferase [Williamsoniiplasma luminosum]|uniref:TIGR02206 family membrane protein n=1 Tax=Williamsoniiplasma luminosum TaxID=214888 RepID=A0A2S0NJ63_9MOLU|nr:YwaF family protein [Williamsoniiplasma luminosum]AVP49060.1 MAG: hypothetical protein C5T88_00470 [Williamsoniiplasma luminosum]